MTHPARAHLTKEDYSRAESLLHHNRSGLVAGTTLAPHWVGDRFWAKFGGPRGTRHLVVDPNEGTTMEAFDHERAAQVLRNSAGFSSTPDALPVTHIDPDSGTVHFILNDEEHRLRTVVLTLADYSISAETHPDRTPWELLSPDRQWVVFVHDHNLWIRSQRDGSLRALTTDGTGDESYAECPDPGQRRPLLAKLGAQMAPAAVWSSDSARILTHRLDQRGVSVSTVVEANPTDGTAPRFERYRYPLPGDSVVPTARMLSVEIATGAITWADTEPVITRYLAPTFRKELWFVSPETAYFISRDRYFRTVTLHEFDVVTGEVRTVLVEHDDRRVEINQFTNSPPIVTVLPQRHEVLWWSQRDGFGHLYRYSLDGRLVGAVTHGDWLVTEILHVDPDESSVYVVSSGRNTDDLYLKQLLRIDLADGSMHVVVEDDLDHEFSVSPSGRFVLDRASRVDVPTISTVIEPRGTIRYEVHRVDPRPLEELGWSPRVRFRVVAADGITPLWGTLTLPHAFDENRSYPLVDDLYPGPQINRSSPAWHDPFFTEDMDALASLGIATMTLDGRGTPGRSRDFHHAAYGHLGMAGSVNDHVAAIHQLAQRHPWIDLDRVGAKGLSGGGRATVRSMLDAPELYRVGVAWSGSHDERFYQSHWFEGYQGPAREYDWPDAVNQLRAHLLEGKLLLAHGEIDENVHLTQTSRLIDALISANKDFDFVLVPSADHGFAGSLGYLTRRSWDYLVRHLLDAEPPQSYLMTEPPLDLFAPGFLRC